MRSVKNGGFVEKSMGGSRKEQYMAEVMVNLSRDVEDLCKLYEYLRETGKEPHHLCNCTPAFHHQECEEHSGAWGRRHQGAWYP